MRSRAVLLLVLVASCSKASYKRQASYAPDEKGLHSLAADFMGLARVHDKAGINQLAQEIVDVDAKFWTDTFGPEVGGKLAAEAKDDAADAGHGALAEFFGGVVDGGKSEIHVLQIDKATDDNANGVQAAMFDEMKKHVTLWKVSITKPGQEYGSSLWSFTVIDGKWKLLGKCKSAKPDYDPLDEMPLKMLKESAAGE